MDKDSMEEITKVKMTWLTEQNKKKFHMPKKKKKEKSNDKLGTLFSTNFKNKGIIIYTLCVCVCPYI